jgi:methylamine dehydrogenase accessory protein MauD
LALVSLLSTVGQIHLKRDPKAQALITDEGPELHSPLPEFEGRDTTGRLIRVADYRGRNLALLLLGAECPPCEQLGCVVPRTYHALEHPPEFLIVLDATPGEAAAFILRHRLDCPVIIDKDASIRTLLGVERAPYGFLIDASGVVRMKGVVNNRKQLEGLIGRRGQHLGALTWVSATHDRSPSVPNSS